MIGPARAAARGRGASGTGPLIAASGVGWLVGPIVAGVIADATGWRISSAVLAVATLPLIPLVARYASPRTTGERLESLRLRAALRPRPPQPRDRRRRARQRAARGRRRRLRPAPAARARRQRPVGRRDRARVRPLGRRLDRRRHGRRPAAGLGRAPARRRHHRGRPRRRLAAAGLPPLDARARRVPARLDRLPVDDQRAQLRRRRARERGHLGADGDRRDEPRVGRDGARHPAARGARGGKLRGAGSRSPRPASPPRVLRSCCSSRARAVGSPPPRRERPSAGRAVLARRWLHFRSARAVSSVGRAGDS